MPFTSTNDMAKSGKLWIGIYAACCSALPFACSFTSILPRVALEYGQMVCALATSAFGLRLVDAAQLGVQRHIQEKPASSLLRFTVAVTLMSLAFRAIFSRPAAALIALPKQAE